MFAVFFPVVRTVTAAFQFQAVFVQSDFRIYLIAPRAGNLGRNLIEIGLKFIDSVLQNSPLIVVINPASVYFIGY
jgi:hypothetical protein